MKIDEENNKVYLNDEEMVRFELFKGIYTVIKIFLIGCGIGLVIEIIKFILSSLL